jgi:site-specific DNA recombinase
MTKRIVIYSRYSSDLQSDSSIEDQVRLCSERANKEGWQIVNSYSDAGISGASLMRSGIQGLIQAAMNGEFDIVLCEAMDRLSRDQEDIAGLYKRLEFAGVKIITLSEGEINTMHIGLKGTMNAMFLKDLADKTRRGLRGRVENGKSGGGIAYGYKVIKAFDAHGEPIKGGREIDQEQAEIVQRIFKEYANDNKSPKAIAAQFNKEGIPCPSGKEWGQSTINGNRKRGTGILNNELYIGRLIWNRQRMIKDPMSGKRVTRINDESEWVIQEVPELRIIPQELWDAAKARQAQLTHTGDFNTRKRPKYLLSDLLKCGECGGGFSKVNSERYGCSNARNKGESVCTNRHTIKRDILEETVLSALQTRLMREDMIEVFCAEYTKRMNELLKSKDAHVERYKSELSQCRKERENLVQALKDGVPASMVKDDLETACKRIEELEELITDAKRDQKPLLHPSMAMKYQQEVAALRQSLNKPENRGQAAQHLRALVEKIVLTPKKQSSDGEAELSIDLYGDIAGILSIALKEKNMPSHNEKRLKDKAVNNNTIFEPSVRLVAGAGFEPTTFGL